MISILRLPRLSATPILIATAAFIALTNNIPLWSLLSQDTSLAPTLGWIIRITLFLLVTGVLSLAMLALTPRLAVKPVAVVLLLITAIIGYFNRELGVIFHLDMIRNLAENIRDHNAREALELISRPLLEQVFLYGIAPAAIVIFTAIRANPLKRELGQRLLGLSLIGVLLLIIALPNANAIKSFGKEHRNLRVSVNPITPFMSLASYIQQQYLNNSKPFHLLGQDARQVKQTNKRVIGLMVVGETARADHFSLNGYARQTNPMLEKDKLINFPQTRSCGTSTIYSVPCMFSLLDHGDYSPEIAATQSNVLDVIVKAGVKVIWIDNNSSCKGVCQRVESINFREYPDPSLPYFGHGEYFDEILLYQLEEKINATKDDVLIVLHMLGSHGPAYYKRVPEGFDKFQPQCTANTYQSCKNNQEFVNEYDNTIVYTDFVLHKTIEFLRKRDNDFDSFMLYSSDHGESLGEDGVYLHGAPIATAPAAQTRVPFFAWLSDGYIHDHHLDIDKLTQQAKNTHSHDNLSHSLLGLFNVKSDVYNASLDIFDSEPKSALNEKNTSAPEATAIN